MDKKSLKALLAKLRARGSELDSVEAKTAKNELPKKLIRTLTAFANREDGGTILLGIGDAPDFKVVGVEGIDYLQSRIASTVQTSLNPPPPISLSTVHLDDKTVLVLKVDEVSYHQKPCYIVSQGIQGGAYKRVGDQDHAMSPYEIFLLQQSNTIPREDLRPVAPFDLNGATETFQSRILSYITHIRKRSSSDYLQSLSDEKILEARHIVFEGKFTLMGVLTFSEYPQEWFPKLRITYLSYPERMPDAASISKERYKDNKLFEGPILEILEDSLRYLQRQLRESLFVKGAKNERVSELPELALREALLNAIVHRDYSTMARGREIQIRVFPDRIEIENPGGLYGGIRVASIRSHQSVCRNSHLATLLEDLGIMENQGDGIMTMYSSLESRGLPEPTFVNSIDSFTVIFRRIDTSDSSSAKQASKGTNSEKEFLKAHPDFSRSDVLTELKYTEGEAKYFLKKYLSEGLIEKYGAGRGTRYRVTRG